MVFESWTVFLLHVRCFFNVIKCCRHWMLKANSYISRFWPWIPEINCASVLWHLLWLSLCRLLLPSNIHRETHTQKHTHMLLKVVIFLWTPPLNCLTSVSHTAVSRWWAGVWLTGLTQHEETLHWTRYQIPDRLHDEALQQVLQGFSCAARNKVLLKSERRVQSIRVWV